MTFFISFSSYWLEVYIFSKQEYHLKYLEISVGKIKEYYLIRWRK